MEHLKKNSRLYLIPAIAAALTLASCSTTPTVNTSSEESTEASATAEEAEAEAEPEQEVGARSNPAPIGTKLTDGDWALTIDAVNTNANDIIVNEWNEPPADGNAYILVTATVEYLGSEDAGEDNYSTISYVTADGDTIDQAWVDTSGSGEDDFTTTDPIYPNSKHTGVLAFEVPEALDGTLAVTVDMLSDRKFVAIK